LCLQLRLPVVVVELDAQAIVNIFSSSNSYNGDLCLLVDDCKELGKFPRPRCFIALGKLIFMLMLWPIWEQRLSMILFCFLNIFVVYQKKKKKKRNSGRFLFLIKENRRSVLSSCPRATPLLWYRMRHNSQV
jgi:hypothetical protein